MLAQYVYPSLLGLFRIVRHGRRWRALQAPLESVYRMELSPASVSVISHYPGDEGGEAMSSLRLFNARPGDLPLVL